jgi:hypothetical protein
MFVDQWAWNARVDWNTYRIVTQVQV